MEPRPEHPNLVSLLGLDRPGVGAASGLRERDELYVMWSAARAEANAAYDAWTQSPGAEKFWAYRACEERADAAQDALAEACRRYPTGDQFTLAA
jgi:hypothetical protein